MQPRNKISADSNFCSISVSSLEVWGDWPRSQAEGKGYRFRFIIFAIKWNPGRICSKETHLGSISSYLQVF